MVVAVLRKKNIKLLDPNGGPLNDTILTIVDCAKKITKISPEIWYTKLITVITVIDHNGESLNDILTI